MIIWGGSSTTPFGANTGGRYNPGADIWTPTTTAHAPSGRNSHTAVWTGTEMIVWGELAATTTLTRVEDTIPERIVGQLPALPTLLQRASITQPFGWAVK